VSRPLSPSGRSIKLMESEGYAMDIVERRIPRTLITKDLFGFIDLLGIHRETGEIKAIQATSASNVSARIRKITDSPFLALVRKAGWSIEVHGWHGDRKGAHSVRRVDIS
jgi:hypothetical protein